MFAVKPSMEPVEMDQQTKTDAFIDIEIVVFYSICHKYQIHTI